MARCSAESHIEAEKGVFIMEFLIIWLICAGVGALLTGWSGAALGLLLGPIGVVIAIIQSSKDE